MQTSAERIEEFQRLYRDAYGQEISLDKARDMATRLVEFYRIIMRPLPGVDAKKPPEADSPAPRNTS